MQTLPKGRDRGGGTLSHERLESNSTVLLGVQRPEYAVVCYLWNYTIIKAALFFTPISLYSDGGLGRGLWWRIVLHSSEVSVCQITLDIEHHRHTKAHSSLRGLWWSSMATYAARS